MVKHALKILPCSHRRILKVCLTVFQHYAWKVQTATVEIFSNFTSSIVNGFHLKFLLIRWEIFRNCNYSPVSFFLKVNHQKKLLLYCNLQKKWSVSACGLKQKIYPKKVEKQNLRHKTLRFLTFPKVLEALKSKWYCEKL